MASKTKKTVEASKGLDEASVARDEIRDTFPAPGRKTDQPAGGIAISPKDAATLEKPIDSRMAALLKDHQEMGARPK